jgi:hypothetical protein
MSLNNDTFSMLSFPANNLMPIPKADSAAPAEISKSSEPAGLNNRFRIKRTRTYNHNRALPLLMPAGAALYHWSRSPNKPKIANIRSKIVDTAKSPEFKDAISEISHFLDLGIQHNLYTIMGIIDILSATKSLADGSFQKQHIKIPLTGETKNSIRTFINVIKRLKTGINGQVLDNAVLSYEISDKLFELMRKENSGSPKDIITKRFDDLLYIFRPLMPQKYSSNIGKFTKLIKIAQAINATDDIMTSYDTESIENSNKKDAGDKLKTVSPDMHATDSELKRENSDGSASETENLNAGALDLAAKLMKLLS